MVLQNVQFNKWQFGSQKMNIFEDAPRLGQVTVEPSESSTEVKVSEVKEVKDSWAVRRWKKKG